METIKDEPVTEHDIAAWADEAEQGYDVAGSSSWSVVGGPLGPARGRSCPRAWTGPSRSLWANAPSVTT